MFKVTLPLDNIFQHVTLLTGRAGSARGRYDDYVCSSDNYPALRLLVPDCITDLEGELRLFMGASNEFTLVAVKEDIIITFSGDWTHRLAKALLNNIRSQLRLALSNMLAGFWLQGVDSEAASNYISAGGSYVKTVVGLVTKKDLGITEADYSTAQEDDVDQSSDSNSSDMENPRYDDCIVRPSALANVADKDGLVLEDENGVTLNFNSKPKEDE